MTKNLITPEMVRAAQMKLVGGGNPRFAYINIYRCVEFPELEKVVCGDDEDQVATFSVSGKPVPDNWKEIAHAINVWPKRNPPPPPKMAICKFCGSEFPPPSHNHQQPLYCSLSHQRLAKSVVRKLRKEKARGST